MIPNLKEGQMHIYEGYNKNNELIYYQYCNYKIRSGIMQNIIIKNNLYILKLINENMNIYYNNDKKLLLIKNLFLEDKKSKRDNSRKAELHLINGEILNNKFYTPLSYFIYFLLFKMDEKGYIKELDIKGFDCRLSEVIYPNIQKLSVNTYYKYKIYECEKYRRFNLDFENLEELNIYYPSRYLKNIFHDYSHPIYLGSYKYYKKLKNVNIIDYAPDADYQFIKL